MAKKTELNYTQELLRQLELLEDLLKKVQEPLSSEDLNQIYSLTHKINENSGLWGINTLQTLFSPVEKSFSELIKTKGETNSEQIGVLISSIQVGIEALHDPTLKKTNLKSNFDAMKKKISEVFETKKDKKETDNAFSNSRFQDIFIDEANDLINQLEEKLLQLESQPDDTGLVDNVFRIMHTLKGNSNMFGYVYLGEITHHLENVYDAIRSHKLDINRPILEITLQCVDHFRNLIDDPEMADEGNKLVQEGILNDLAEMLHEEHTEKMPKTKKQAEDGLNTYYIYFRPQPNVFDDGSNPLYYVSDLNELGQCLIQAVTENIPADQSYNPETCYTLWHILLATKESRDAILDTFMFLHHDSQPIVNLIAKGNVLKEKEILTKFKDTANATQPLTELFAEKASKEIDISKPIVSRTINTKSQDAAIASIRVASTKVDLMMNLISELVTKQAELSMIASENDIVQLQEVAESIESISRDLRDNAFSISLIPLEKSVLRFQRLVRDVSAKFNKLVDFVVEGKETELDKTIIEKIVDPIMHILRNSIDHGIEIPEVRRQLGKPETGTITLKAYPSGAHVVIEIADDGSGINVEKVRTTAVKRGFIGVNDDLKTDEMLKLILSPGFTTADNISEVSGRGVGMDVVFQKISEIRGELDIQTEQNKGTIITIKLPLTISIIDSMLVKLSETFYLIPLSVVERCAEVPTPVITESPVEYLNLDGRYLPFIDLHNEFDFTDERPDYQRLIIVNYKGVATALVVDQIVGNYQAVLKSLGQVYRRQEIISGASILGNGEVALVLDTNRLVQEFMATRETELNRLNELNMKVI